MNVFALLEQTSKRHGSSIGVFLGDEPILTFQQLRDRSLAIASALSRLGAPGERVGIVSANCVEYVEILFAAWSAAMAIVPINYKLHEKEMAEIVEDAQPILIFASAGAAASLAPLLGSLTDSKIVVIGSAEYQEMTANAPMAPRDAQPDDLAWLFYTSGTTGRSKGAMLSHRNLMAMTVAHLADLDEVEPVGTLLHGAPMSHGSGLYIPPYIARGARQVIPRSQGFDPPEFLGLCRSHSRVSCFLAPTMIQRLRIEAERSGIANTNLHRILYGGGPMYVDELRKCKAVFGPVLAQLYGQGESPMTITGLRCADHETDDDAILGSVGWPRLGVDVQIVDSDDMLLPVGETGEVVCRGDVVMRGYWQNPQASADALRGGWLHTGDLGAFDASGRLTLKGRSKELIISGGANIYAREVEEAVLSHPRVSEVAVLGKPHVEWGEVVVAFVVVEKDCNLASSELDDHCIQRIARFKRPKLYVFVDELPKNSYGKVLKRELAKQFTG